MYKLKQHSTPHGEIFREKQGQVHTIGSNITSGYIEDFGSLQGVLPGSMGYYVFEDTSTGSQGLVIVGAATEVVGFLAKHAHSGIENRITALLAIYMGTTPYRPHERFKVTVPIFDVAKQFVGTLASAGQEVWGATPTPLWIS